MRTYQHYIISLVALALAFSMSISSTGMNGSEETPVPLSQSSTAHQIRESSIVNLTCIQNTSVVSAGGSHTYQINVTNTGPGTDTINLTIDNPTGWRAHFNDNLPGGSSPDNPGAGSRATSYRNYTGTVSEMYAIEAAHPDLVNVTVIGSSWEGRDIHLIKISDNVTVDEAEPEVLYMGMHHAREWMTVEVVMYFLNHLADNYGTEPQATWTVNNREIFLVPIMNPDGYVYSQEVQNMWRKNRRDNGDGTWGVDPNRNYDGAQNGDPNGNWGEGIGTSHITSSDVYCGPSAFSEPCTQAIRDLVIAWNFSVTISYHSYGREIYWPWGYDIGVQTPDHVYQEAIAQNMAAINGYTPKQSAVAYPTTGDTDDWVYGYSYYVLGRQTYPFTIELDSSFQPSVSQIDPTCELNLGVNFYITDIAGNLLLNSPTIAHEPLQNTLDTVGPYTVSANITTSVGLQPGSTRLFWKNDSQWNELPMSNITGETWEADIPGQVNDTWVYYYIETKDLNNHTSAEPKYSPYESHMFRVGPDVIEYSVMLDPSEWRMVNLVVEAPPTALHNEVAVIDVIGTSENSPAESDSVETVTTINPAILLVNDNNVGIANYRIALDNNGYIYDDDKPSTANLQNYNVVIWATDGLSPLDLSERAKIEDFLNAGGNLYINGEDIGWQADNEGWTLWYNTYLHAIFNSDDSGAATMDGITGDEITDEMMDYPVSGDYPSEISPADGSASIIFKYDTVGNPGAGLKADTGTYRLVYMACEYFEGMDLQSNRNLLMQRIVDWLTPQPLIFNIPIISTGWNFISFPLKAAGSVSDVLKDSAGDGLTTWDIVRWYDAHDPADPWKQYASFMPANLCDLPDVNNTMGLWVNVTALGDGFLTVQAAQPMTTTIQLKAGWNLVGYPSATPSIASVTLPGTVDVISIFNASAPYLLTDKDPSIVTMEAGKGYWVHCNADATWIVDW